MARNEGNTGPKRLGRRGQEAAVKRTRHMREQLLHRNVQRFRGGLVFKAHGLCVSLNSRLESDKEEEKKNSANIRQSGPESGPGFHAKVLQTV